MLQLAIVILQRAIVILHRSHVMLHKSIVMLQKGYVILQWCLVCHAKYFCNITMVRKPAAKCFLQIDSVASLANLPRFYVDKKVIPAAKNKKMPRFKKNLHLFSILLPAFTYSC